jgi:uncharacterized membrane protein
MAVGLMAGVFGLYAHTIMPGLGDTDDRTFVGAFQAIDEAIENPVFLPTLVGALMLTGLAALLHLRGSGRSAVPWIAAAFVLYLAAFVITIGVHLPLNDDIKAAGDPDRIADLAAVRERFNGTGGSAGTSSGLWPRRPPSAAWPGRSCSTAGSKHRTSLGESTPRTTSPANHQPVPCAWTKPVGSRPMNSPRSERALHHPHRRHARPARTDHYDRVHKASRSSGHVRPGDHSPRRTGARGSSGAAAWAS